MIDPLILLGIEPVYYRLDSELHVDLEDFQRCLGIRVKAAVVTHFFGRNTPIQAIRELSDRHGIALIEDCAHSFIGPSGCVGDYAAYSLTKFFPVFEGGMLASGARSLDGIRVQHPGMLLEAKAAAWAYQYASRYGREPLGHRGAELVERLRTGIDRRSRKRLPKDVDRQGRSVGPAAAEGASGLEFEWVDRSMSLFSRWVAQRSDLDAIAASRRANWRALSEMIRDVEAVSILGGSELRPDEVPYALPVIVERDDATVHRELMGRGVPVYRWDSPHPTLDPAQHPRARRLAGSLLQFPVHQSLHATEIEWIADGLRKAVHQTRPASSGVIHATS
jgi:hypothetical protein